MMNPHFNLSQESGVAFENRLLAALPREEYERLSSYLEPVKLPPGKIVYNAGEFIRHAYFPRSGQLSLLSMTERGRTIEVGMIGNEGVAGVSLILGSDVIQYQVMVQIALSALRLKKDVLRVEFRRGGRLQDLLLSYTNTIINQIAQSAACNRFHTVEERLCRWLLVCHDRVRGDTIPLTQEFLSHMLGVPRSSVTAVAGALQQKRLINYSRGKIHLLDRARLEMASCECYRLVRDEFKNFLVA